MHLAENGNIGKTMVQVEEDRDLAIALTISYPAVSIMRMEESTVYNTVSNVKLPTKGIQATPVGTFRVQLNKTKNSSKKFTKNVSDLVHALWLFEIAVLICDQPLMLDTLLKSGNYQYLLENGYTSNPLKYKEDLRYYVNDLSKKKILKNNQADEAIGLLTIMASSV